MHPYPAARAACLAVLCAGAVLAVPQVAVAEGGWSVSGRVSQRFDADTNSQLEADGAATYRSSTTLALDIATENSRDRLRFSPSVTGSAAAGPGDTDDLTRILPGARIEAGRRWSTTDLTVTGVGRVVPTTFTDTLDDGGDGFVDLDTLEEDALRITGSVAAVFGIDVNARNRITFGPDILLVRFDESSDTLTPSTTFGGQTGITHQIDASQIIGASLRVRRITFGGTDPSTDVVVDLNGSYDRTVNARLSYGLGAGVNFSRSNDDLTDETTFDTGFNGSADLAYSLTPTLNFQLGASQVVDPGSDGDLQARTNGNISLNQRINARNSIGLTARYARQEDLNGAASGSVSQLFSTGVNYRVDLTRSVSGTVGYRFRSDFDDDENALSHGIFFSLSKDISVVP